MKDKKKLQYKFKWSAYFTTMAKRGLYSFEGLCSFTETHGSLNQGSLIESLILFWLICWVMSILVMCISKSISSFVWWSSCCLESWLILLSWMHPLISIYSFVVLDVGWSLLSWMYPLTDEVLYLLLISFILGRC